MSSKAATKRSARSLPKKLRKHIGDLLQQAQRVLRYRGDLLKPEEREAIEAAADDLVRRCEDPETPVETVQEQYKRFDALLRRHGGKIHPKTFLSDNIETIVVAAFVVIGIRTFFLQPFIIPTNSMYPTYSGMQPVVYSEEKAGPAALPQLFRNVALGSSRFKVEAPVSGEVWVGVRAESGFDRAGMKRAAGDPVIDAGDGRKWLVVPAKKGVGILRVGGQMVEIKVPLEFSDLRAVYNEAFFPESTNRDLVENLRRGAFGHGSPETSGNVVFYPLGRTVERGDTLIDFEILSGDALFVDRFTYHFWRPDVGDPVVFRTREIPGLGDRYYIKRLVGAPGDVLELEEPVVYRNGAPLDGAGAFERNQQLAEGHYGYTTLSPNQPYLREGVPMQVPEESYFVLGDNSPNSADGRVWGFVPQQEIIGRAIFIYYPFTGRWGPSE